MGLDGGTIASRSDVLRRASWRVAEHGASRSTRGAQFAPNFVMPSAASLEPHEAEQLARSRTVLCALSHEPLRRPIQHCQMGWLYNKDSVVEFLAGEGQWKRNRDEFARQFPHLACLRDVREAILEDNPEFDEGVHGVDDVEAPARFVCAVSGLPFNGKHDFVVLPCGHCFAKRAVENVGEPPICFTCNAPFQQDDLTPLLATDAGEREQRQAKLVEAVKQRELKKAAKKQRRSNNDDDNPGPRPRVASEHRKESPKADPHKRKRSPTNEQEQEQGQGRGQSEGKRRRAAVEPPLPPGWIRKESKTKPGKVYFVDTRTKRTQWHFPST